jgi:hypothetical protein
MDPGHASKTTRAEKVDLEPGLDYLLRADCDRLRLYLANPAVDEKFGICR